MNTTHFCVMTDPLDKNIKVSDLEVRNDPYVDDRDGDDKCYCSTKTYNKNSNKQVNFTIIQNNIEFMISIAVMVILIFLNFRGVLSFKKHSMIPLFIFMLMLM